ncbi:MAG: RNase adapter RapZ, partial [Clostridia bacterium]|nr:RNase adapter RapZ [Clostridia bacterium]
MRCVIVTGMSGAGRTMALHQLEDMGYFCVDNMPPQMIIAFITSCMQNNSVEKAALVVDTRAGVFFDNIYQAVDDIGAMGVQCDLLFLETADEVLIRRYKESRRAHPMAKDGSISSGIAAEKEQLAELRALADSVIDTSGMKTAQLNTTIKNILYPTKEVSDFTITVASFGYKHGVPTEADMIWDMRFLPNPYYLSSMRHLTGNSRKVSEYVLKAPEAQLFLETMHKLVAAIIPSYIREGKYNMML